MNSKTKADLILHPIRMRVLMALSGQKKTSQQLADELRDIPQATLYRHIALLAKANVIQVVEQRQVRGSIEKVYTIVERAANLTAEDVAGFSKDDHMRYFIAFIASLLDDFSRYLQRVEIVDLMADAISFNKFPLELSDSEMKMLSEQINAAFAAHANNQPAPNRRRRSFSFIIMPDTSIDKK